MLIVPLTIYKNYVFDIINWDKNVNFNDFPFIQLIKLTKQTAHLLLELLKKVSINLIVLLYKICLILMNL